MATENRLKMASFSIIIPFILVVNSLFIYVICKTQIILLSVDKLFIGQSVCDMLTGTLRSINNMVSIAQSPTTSMVTCLLDFSLWPFHYLSICFALWLTVNRYDATKFYMDPLRLYFLRTKAFTYTNISCLSIILLQFSHLLP